MQTIQVGMGWFPEQAGGLNRYYLDLIRHLPDAGVGVTGLVAGSERVAAGSGGTVRAFAPIRCDIATRLQAVRAETRRALAQSPASLFVSHFALYAAPCLDLLGKQPFVVHFHGPWADEGRAEGASRVIAQIKHWLEHQVYRRAPRFIVLSRAFGQVLERRHGVAPDRIRVIAGGVDTARFDPPLSRSQAREQLGWPTNRPIALVVRRLVRRMGLEDLIAAVKLARWEVPELLVLIAGAGPLAAELEARVQAEGLTQHVQLIGFLPDAQLPLAYRAADISIVPSVALEGFGLIVGESLAAGTPVLVTAVGGLPETIEALSPQCIVAERGAQALAASMVGAFLGRYELPSAAECARHAHERFDWSVVAGRVRAVYDEVIQ